MMKRVFRLCVETGLWLLSVVIVIALCCGAAGASAIHPWRAVSVALAAAFAAPVWWKIVAALAGPSLARPNLRIPLGPRAALELGAETGLTDVAIARSAIDRLIVQMEAEVASEGARTYRDALCRLADDGGPGPGAADGKGEK